MSSREFNYQKFLAETAKKEGVTPEEVHNHMMAAIEAGMQSDDPAVQKQWKELFNDNKPTPEEFIKFAADKAAEGSVTH